MAKKQTFGEKVGGKDAANTYIKLENKQKSSGILF